MKKVTATILLNGENKTVTVMLDDRTYTLLKQADNKELFLQYVTEEYLRAYRPRKACKEGRKFMAKQNDNQNNQKNRMIYVEREPYEKDGKSFFAYCVTGMVPVSYRIGFCMQTGNGINIDVSPDHILF